MKPNTSRQEILMFTGTSLSKRQLAEKNDTAFKTNLSPAEELEKICWAGLLYELLPEVISFQSGKHNTHIREIIPAKNYIRVRMGPYPEPTPGESSIDPYLFFANIFLN